MKQKLLTLMFIAFIPTAMMAYHCEVDGIYYNVDTSNNTASVTYSSNSYDSYFGSMVIPSSFEYKGIIYSVTSIGFDAFMNCSSLTSVDIPNSVTSIEEWAFYGCSSLASITIPNSVTRIEWGVFSGCTSLTSITIPNSVTRIEWGAFSGCTSLTSINIPNSVTEIRENPFSGCSSLTSITVGPGNTVFDSRDNCNAIIETSSNMLVAGCKNTIIPNSVTRIKRGAFSDCTSLTSINIPNSVTSIGDYAFSGCSSLASITIPNGVTSIGYEAFEGCSSLASITIPNGVTRIEWGVFSGCTSLTSINIPNSVTEISENPFSGCSSLTSITVGPGNTVFDSRDNCNAIIETSSNMLVAGCKNTIIPNTVTSIGRDPRNETWTGGMPSYTGAFEGCSSLISITIPNSVSAIGVGTFQGCSSLTSIVIPNSVTCIGNMAFSGCSSLASITVGPGNTVFDSRDNCNAIIETSSNMLVAGCKNTIIPNSVTSIGEGSFSNCTSLTSINIPNSVTSIWDYAFSGCTNLTSINIPNSVTSIGEGAFSNCTSLTSINIPNSVTSIWDYAFSGCTNLTSINIPNSVTIIGEGAFWGCSSLTSINIPNSVISIDHYAFVGCSGLTSITIPNSVTSIGYAVFYGCSSLKSVTVEWEEPLNLDLDRSFHMASWDEKNVPEEVFDEETKNHATLYVPAGTRAAYMTAYEWEDFKNIKVLSTLIADMGILYTCKDATLSISLDNEETQVAFEFYLRLPVGVGIALDVDGYPDATLNEARSNNHILEVEESSDGNYHFLCYSNSNKALKGNSGELLSVNLVCDEDMGTGTYQAILSNIKFVDADENRAALRDLCFNIEVVDITMGDVNNDGDIDVLDIVTMVNYIMENPSANFVFAAADHDEDGQVDVIDLVKEVRLVMSQTANAPSTSFDLLSGDLSLITEKDGAMTLNIDDAASYVASQFVVKLSHGQHLVDVTTDNNHIVSIEQIGDNRYVVVSYSNTNSNFTSAMTLHVEGCGEIEVENATFVNEKQEKVSFQNINVGYTDGIRYCTYDFAKPADIYSLSGTLLRKNATSTEGLKAGVYVINGKKYVKK